MKSNVKILIGDIIQQCFRNKCSFKLIADTVVGIGGIECSGYYDGDDLIVAGGAGKKEWLDVLVHESCHMDQFEDKFKYWDESEDGLVLLDDWLLGKKKRVSKEKLEEAIKNIIMLELDCEKRSVKKMERYKIPFNKGLYIQKANSYLFSYWATLRDKKWFKFPYENPKIYKKMPKHFLDTKYYFKNIDEWMLIYK
jgi:hypothetical protein